MRFLAFFLFFLLTSASAEEPANRPLAISAITEQQHQIRADIEEGNGRYRDMPASKRNEVLARQNRLLAILDGKQSADDLTQGERNDVFNSLEWIEAAINNDEDDRMICKFERTTGSNRKTRVCRTTAQIEREREEARRRVDNGNDLGGFK